MWIGCAALKSAFQPLRLTKRSKDSIRRLTLVTAQSSHDKTGTSTSREFTFRAHCDGESRTPYPFGPKTVRSCWFLLQLDSGDLANWGFPTVYILYWFILETNGLNYLVNWINPKHMLTSDCASTVCERLSWNDNLNTVFRRLMTHFDKTSVFQTVRVYFQSW